MTRASSKNRPKVRNTLLVGALVVELGTPGVLVRREPKEYFVTYGDDPALGDPRLAGERLEPGTRVHLIDDLLYSGVSLGSAASVLASAGLVVREASVIVGADRTERVASMSGRPALSRSPAWCWLQTLTCPPADHGATE